MRMLDISDNTKKKQEQSRQQFLAFLKKKLQRGQLVKALDCYSNTLSVRGFESHLCRNPFGDSPET